MVVLETRPAPGRLLCVHFRDKAHYWGLSKRFGLHVEIATPRAWFRVRGIPQTNLAKDAERLARQDRR